MINPHILRTAVSVSLIATAALSGVAHADTTSEIAKFNPATKTYCVARMETGSKLAKQVCETYHGWIQQGAKITPVSHLNLAAQ